MIPDLKNFRQFKMVSFVKHILPKANAVFCYASLSTKHPSIVVLLKVQNGRWGNFFLFYNGNDNVI